MALHPSIRIEGGLLGPDLIDQLRAGELQGQKPADFALRPPASPAAKSRARADRTRESRPAYGEKPRPKRTTASDAAIR